MDRILRLLKECGIKTYTVTSTKKESVELFFIKKNVDMRRMNRKNVFSITVYKDMLEEGKKIRGFASILVNESDADDEIKNRIMQSLDSAKYVKNPYFELPVRELSKEVDCCGDLSGKSLDEIAEEFTSAAYSADCDEKAFINSFEVFVTEKHVRVVTSEETDVSYVTREIEGEFVAQCKEPQDVETYMDFKYNFLGKEEIKELIKNTLQVTKDRAKATAGPKSGKYDVILSDRYVPVLLQFFLDRANAGLIYQGFSSFKTGENVQGTDVSGDVFDITYGVTNAFDSAYGNKMEERPMLEGGVLRNIHGAPRFSHYIGVPKIGTYEKVKIPAGSMGMTEMKNRKCLHVVNFSDFQMDPLSGHFGGEIRLAYLYDGEGNVSVVTGGSINGSFLSAMKNVRLSRETEKLWNYEGPKAVLLTDISVAGE